jgi:hypothetical protein
MTAILIQVEKDKAFGTDIHHYLFDGMDPFTIQVLDSKDTNPGPFIMIAFATCNIALPHMILVHRAGRRGIPTTSSHIGNCLLAHG